MRNLLVGILVFGGLFSAGFTASAQNVSAITARQVGDEIEVSFYIDKPADYVQLSVSTDGGKTFSSPLKKVYGNTSNLTSKGRHSIRWEVLEEYDGLVGDDIVFMVTAWSDKKAAAASSIGFSGDQYSGRTVGRRHGQLYWKDNGKKLTDEEYKQCLGETLYKEYCRGRDAYQAANWMTMFTLIGLGGGIALLNTDAYGWGIAITVFGGLCGSAEVGAYLGSISTINGVKKAYNQRVKAQPFSSLGFSPSVSRTYDNNYALGATLTFKF